MTVGSVPPRTHADRAGAALALCGPTRRLPIAASKRMMLPPPAPTERTSSVGTQYSYWPCQDVRRLSATPLCMRPTSNVVPPISAVMTSTPRLPAWPLPAAPTSSVVAALCEPIRPATGPEPIVSTGSCRASVVEISPPEQVMIWTWPGKPRLVQRSCRTAR